MAENIDFVFLLTLLMTFDLRLVEIYKKVSGFFPVTPLIQKHEKSTFGDNLNWYFASFLCSEQKNSGRV